MVVKNPAWFVKVDGGGTLTDELIPAGAKRKAPASTLPTEEHEEETMAASAAAAAPAEGKRRRQTPEATVAWSPEEDAELRAVVQREGVGNWQRKADAGAAGLGAPWRAAAHRSYKIQTQGSDTKSTFNKNNIERINNG